MTQEQRAEARRLCSQAYSLLRQARELADSAQGWGVADLLGGGLISTMVKRDKMSSAQERIALVRPILRRLNELLGQSQPDGLDLQQPGSAATFFDYSDSFFAELFVQRHIGDMKRAIERAMERLRALEKQLS